MSSVVKMIKLLSFGLKPNFNDLFKILITFSYLLKVRSSENPSRSFGIHVNNNDSRIITHVTNILGENNVLITNTKLAYMLAEGKLTEDLSWFDTICQSTILGQFASLSNYKFKAFSIMFPTEYYINIKSTLTISSLKMDLSTIIQNHKSSISYLIVHPEYELNGSCHCLWDNNYKKVTTNNHNDHFIHLGLEFDWRFIDCCNTVNFDILQIVHFTIFQVRFNPYTQLSSYGIFSTLLKTVVINNREFVRNFNSNCTMYLRFVYIGDKIDNPEINHRYKVLMAKYVNAWIEENKSEERFIVETYPLDIDLPDNLETLKRHVSPRFVTSSEFRNTETVPLNNREIHIFSRENEYIALQISNTLDKVQFLGKEIVYQMLNIDSKHMKPESSSFKFNHTSILFDEENMNSDSLIRLITKLAENVPNLNLNSVYFSPQDFITHDSLWNQTVSVLHTRNVTIGGYIHLQGYNYTSFIDSMRSLPKTLGPIWNTASEIIVELVNVDTLENMPIVLFSFEKARNLFKLLHSNKTLIPSIVTQSNQKAPDKQFGKHSAVELNIHQSYTPEKRMLSLYCDPYIQLVNEVYDGILTFASINRWKKLFLRHAVSPEGTGSWWLNVETNRDYVDRNKTQYPLLIRTNAEKSMQKDKQMPMTFQCLTWTKKSVETGIQFQKNPYVGTTVHLFIKNDLTKRELQTMLLFAFGKFSNVELSINTKSEFDLVFSSVMNEEFLNIIRTGRKTLVYLEIPLKLASEIKLNNSFPIEVAFHFSGLEKYTNHIKRDADLKSVGRKKSANNRFGLTVMDCGNEVNSKFSGLRNISLIFKIDYIVCHTKPVLPKNRNQTWMAEYLHTFFYIKKYIETFLPKYTGLEKSIEVILRLNYQTEPKCYIGLRDKTENFLRFLSDVNKHSQVYKTRYFIVKSFENESMVNACPSSWWKISKYDDLTNVSVFVNREEEHFGRLTKLEFRLPPENDERLVVHYSLTQVLVYSIISIIFVCIVVVLWLYLRRAHKQYLNEKEISDFYNGEIDGMEGFDEDLNKLCTSFSSNYEISKSRVKLAKVIGSGEFGTVSFGILDNGLEVAVKVPNSSGSKELFKTALAEVKVLCFLCDGIHQNVLKFIGACTKKIREGKLYTVTEYCTNGSLLNYLRSQHKRCHTEKTAVELYELYKFAYEIASGMEFISNKRVIHGDLATRNVFLDSDNTCKIGDFGLSRKLYELNEYVKKSDAPLPWRWMSIETLKTMEFTTKSDVWSYGITVWEIFSLGTLPYPGLSWNSEFVADLENGMRMEKAEYASDDVHQQLLNCWYNKANERPTFTEIVRFFGHKRESEYVTVLV